ncbi:MAG: DUF4388 domain-containing protein [Ktedonobacterales bacterium]|nr:DUF4388 domain-containing protein [Ktedonobacterales bacterium]
MEQLAVIIIEPSQIVATILRRTLEPQMRCVVMRDAATFEATASTHAPIGLVLLDVMTLLPDASRRERPFWHLLMERPPLPVPVLCFSGTSSTPTDTPLFSLPAETLTIAAPDDFTNIGRTIMAYLATLRRSVQLREALAGTLRPSLRGNFAEFPAEALLRMADLGGYTGTLLARNGLATGIIAFAAGQVVHAIAGALIGKEAVYSINGWTNAPFAFFRGMDLGERSMHGKVDDLILEANRLGDEASDVSASLAPNAYLHRTRTFADQLAGKEYTMSELEALALVDQYHVVREVLAHARHGELLALKALRGLWQKGLIEVVAAEDVPPLTSPFATR